MRSATAVTLNTENTEDGLYHSAILTMVLAMSCDFNKAD